MPLFPHPYASAHRSGLRGLCLGRRGQPRDPAFGGFTDDLPEPCLGQRVDRLTLTDRPAFSVQYHPEASPGPHDSHYLFTRFLNEVRKQKGMDTLPEHKQPAA